MTVVVTGATGTTGSAVVTALVTAGIKVRAVTRSPDRVRAITRPGVEAVAADRRDPAALRATLDGATAAYLVTPTAPDMAASEGDFARAAADAGVHVVKLSTLGASSGSPLRFARAHAAAEAAVEDAGGTWTFVQPNGFMQNDLAWAAQVPAGTIAGPVMDAAWAIVDVHDVAAVAAAALAEPAAHAGRRVRVTGPEARTPRSRVAALATVLGQDLAAIDVPIPRVLEQLRGYGLGVWDADGLAELFELYRSGAGAPTAPDAPEILGRATRPWERFATDNAGEFRAGGSRSRSS